MPIFAQFQIVKDGKPKAEIICQDETTAVNKEAADLLNIFVERISGTKLPIHFGSKRNAKCIIIGEKTDMVDEDGFGIICRGNKLSILSGGGKGAIYGVVHLLEKYMGVNYYAYNAYTLTKSKDISLKDILVYQTPAFRFRQTYSYGNDDLIYKNWFALEDHRDLFAADMWVHTFNRILPSAVYGKQHPEYYSFINGKRQPGEHSQWCLTNPDVFEEACKKIDSIFKSNPDMKMISVSQNDGNNTNCSCTSCKAVDDYEGSPSGTIIRFMNKLARRFPDKEISTLAYLYSMQPPKHVKPLPNVNIMFCSIDCRREVPLTDNASGRAFVDALDGWSKISDNIFVWDYGINFDNVISPFPNFHILQKNMQLFKEKHATMIFEQVNGTKGTDYAEMRAYVLGKLMWNPYLNADSLMLSFLNGYYGKATPYLYRYHKIMQGALLASRKDLWIYDSPITHKNGMLNKPLLKTYNELYDLAEQAVMDDSVKLQRVRLARLSLQYAELEIDRTNPNGDKRKTYKNLALFKERTAAYNIPTINERNNKCADYCELYEKRYLPQKEKNKALGAKIVWIAPPTDRYKPIADHALTDGLYGGTSYVESWVGWEGTDAEFIIDLGEKKSFRQIETDFLHHLGAWILLPAGGSYAVSDDNKNFTEIGTFKFDEDRDIAVKFVSGKIIAKENIEARFIKVKIKGIGQCPSWHYGVGYPAWFFVDEVVVL
ncbi:DUF4838 domain-containing protein [Prevotella phocaeensis]|uniref:DUF4838 domain-containing protein n=1 Tax=Prevotella phocaeensis TaxID=1776388 RepID=UPI001E388805|nr:DUF4838 domain-containing protein [Prevotella phocaeensis]